MIDYDLLDEQMLDEWDNPSFTPFQDKNEEWVDSEETEEKNGILWSRNYRRIR